MRDVAIIGGGPAGLALAHSLVMRGVDAVVFSPESPWHATYGAWRDDVESCELGAPLDALVRGAWSTVRVVGTREHLLRRPYVVFDNSLLAQSLRRTSGRVTGTVVHVEHSLEHSTLNLGGDAALDAKLVIDATGGGAFLARRSRSGANAVGAQTAYGLVFAAGRAPAAVQIRDDVFTLMDWSTPPTFLYAASFRDGNTLVEETSLFADPPHDIDELRHRLANRLGADHTEAAGNVERVNIPMGDALPSRTTRTVGFGAAAGYVHPVTGYSVAASLRAAPRVASAIKHALARGELGQQLALSAWLSVWPTSLVRTRAWHDMGLAVLRSMPPARIPHFFDAFFSLPTQRCAEYLRIDSQPAHVRAAMLGVFARVDFAMRLRLMAAPGALLRALVAR